MNTVTWSYTVYLALSVLTTVWVARTLHRNGRVFLVEAFHGNEAMADSVNHLLVVGFYLINVGYVTLAMSFGNKPDSLQQSFEFLSIKFGLVLIVLGAMHFFNMFNFDKMRRKARASNEARRIIENMPKVAEAAIKA
jgi:membrane-bound ClpP family serine protease